VTLIASWGGADSNAYINVSQANSFIKSAIFDHSSWDGLSGAQKSAAVIQASQDIDSRQYIGHRFNHDQLLEFPRQMRSAYPFNRTVTATITQDVIQRRMQINVQQACAHQALFIARQGGFNAHAERIQAGIKGVSETVGPINTFIQYGQRSSAGGTKLTPQALSLLQEWTTGRRIYRK
jgi:hypothetical protein